MGYVSNQSRRKTMYSIRHPATDSPIKSDELPDKITVADTLNKFNPRSVITVVLYRYNEQILIRPLKNLIRHPALTTRQKMTRTFIEYIQVTHIVKILIFFFRRLKNTRSYDRKTIQL